MKKSIALMALTGILTLASCGQPGGSTLTCTAPQVPNADGTSCITPVTPVTTGSLIVTKPDTVSATVRDSSGAVVAPTSYNALAPGAYTITYAQEGYVSQTANFNIVAGQTTQLTAPALVKSPTASKGVYYTDASGNLVAVPAADLTDPSKFVFNAWLENLYQSPSGYTLTATDTEVGIMPTPNAITGNAINPERTEVAPARTQNLAVAYVGYKAADGKIYPVSGATVRWNIMGNAQTAMNDNTPFTNNEIWNNSVIFGAADEGVNDTNMPGGIQPLWVSAAGKQADTITNSARGTNLPFPAKTANYPLYNGTGVGTPDMNGVTWTTLFSPDSYASARVVAVAAVNGMEIDKQVLDKFFAAPPELTVDKRFVDDSDTTDYSLNVSSQVDGAVPVDTNSDGTPDGWVNMQITVGNTGGTAQNIDLSDVLSYGNADVYRIIDSAYVVDARGRTRLVPTGSTSVVNATDATRVDWTYPVPFATETAVQVRVYPINATNLAPANATRTITVPVTVGADGFYTIDPVTAANYNLALGTNEKAVINFLVSADKSGTYCDLATVNSYYSPFFGANTTNIADDACAIFTAPNFTITKSFDAKKLETRAVAARNTEVPVYITVTNNGNQPGTFNNVTEYLTRYGTAATGWNMVSAPYTIDPVTNQRVYTQPYVNQPNYQVTAPSDGGVIVPDSITWANATPTAANGFLLQPGESKTFTFNVQANADGRYCDESIINTTSYTQDRAKSGEVCLDVVSLDLTKTNSTNFLRPGDNYVSTITLTNTSRFGDVTVNLWDELGYNKVSDKYVGFGSAYYTLNNGPRVNIDPTKVFSAPAAQANNVTIPAGGKLTLSVTNTVPQNADYGGVFCDYARFKTVNLAGNLEGWKEACVSVITNVALQTQLTDTVDPLTRNNGTNADGRTSYVSILSNEKSSNESIRNSTITYAFGANSPTSMDGLFNNPTKTTVYYLANPQRDPTTGAVTSQYKDAQPLVLGTDYTIGVNAGGEQVINLTKVMAPDSAVFVLHEGVSASSSVPGINPVSGNDVYSTNYQWVTTGAASSTIYRAGSSEPTSVK